MDWRTQAGFFFEELDLSDIDYRIVAQYTKPRSKAMKIAPERLSDAVKYKGHIILIESATSDR